MQSPKFPLKRKDIEEVINVPRLKSRWREKVRDAMRHQPMPDPVEHLDFHVSLDAMCAAIAAEVHSGSYIPHAPIRLLAEKSKGLCRQLVIPSVKDALILQTLSDALWGELQKKAPSKNAFYAPNDHRFSQIRGQTNEYGPVNPWLLFQETIFGFTRSRKYIVVTDIANYYDCISYDHLRNILADLAIAREHSLDLLIYTLSHMLWQPDYMPRIQVGLPQINLDTPRLLAHCFLFEIDKLLMQRPGIDFARYMDDMDVGVDTIAQAKAVLRDLDLSLQTRQIRLNSGKSQILSENDARIHFRIRENAFLDRLEESIKSKLLFGVSITRERKFFEDVIHKGLRARAFDEGNGEKILKRCINYARQYGGKIDSIDFLQLLLKWPGCRTTVLHWWQHSQSPAQQLELIRDFVNSYEIVDDAALIAVASALVAARLPANVRTWRLVGGICDSFDQKTNWGFYAKTWVLSKYGTEDELMRVVEATVSLWVTEEHLSRQVAGLYPRMIGTAHFSKFKAIITKSGNPWCQAVFEFHDALAKTKPGFTAVQKFVRAPNPSQPNKISHSKFLMLCSVLNNPTISATIIKDVKSRHAHALSDEYYKMLVAP